MDGPLHNRTRTVKMGYWWPNADRTPGEYTVEVTSVKPYCQGDSSKALRVHGVVYVTLVGVMIHVLGSLGERTY